MPPEASESPLTGPHPPTIQAPGLQAPGHPCQQRPGHGAGPRPRRHAPFRWGAPRCRRHHCRHWHRWLRCARATCPGNRRPRCRWRLRRRCHRAEVLEALVEKESSRHWMRQVGKACVPASVPTWASWQNAHHVRSRSRSTLPARQAPCSSRPGRGHFAPRPDNRAEAAVRKDELR